MGHFSSSFQQGATSAAIVARLGLSPPEAPKPLPDADRRLDALSARVRHDLATLAYPKDLWVIPRRHPSGAHVYDVVVVGAGQGGLAVAFALLQERVTNILVIDKEPKGREGPWATYSRMWTLRSPKHLTGPDLGIPSLTPRAWFEAMHGEDGWERLGKWPRLTWQAYLDWYRDVLDLPVRNDARLDGIEPADGFLKLTLSSPDGSSDTLWCRKLVLSTGIEGMGDWLVPPFVRALPDRFWTGCVADVDSREWRGRRIAVLGAGATAWDRAADLLEHGAASVTLFMRRLEILKANPFRYLEKAGYLRHYASMDDARKWRWMKAIFAFGQPPTQDGVDRCAAFETFTLHAGAEWRDARVEGEAVEVLASDGTVERFDHLFVGAGFVIDASLRPEFKPFADNIALWRDRFAIPEEDRANALADYPYLAPDLSLVERVPGRTSFFRDIHCFNYGATMSNAHSGASLSGMKYGIEPLIHGITYGLWDADEPEHYRITEAWSAVDTDPTPVLPRLRRAMG